MKLCSSHRDAVDNAVFWFNTLNQMNVYLHLNTLVDQTRKVSWFTSPRGFNELMKREMFGGSPYEVSNLELIVRALGIIDSLTPEKASSPENWVAQTLRLVYNTGPSDADIGPLKRIYLQQTGGDAFSNKSFIQDVLFSFVPPTAFDVQIDVSDAVTSFRGTSQHPEMDVVTDSILLGLDSFTTDVSLNTHILSTSICTVDIDYPVLSSAMNRHVYGPPKTLEEAIEVLLGKRVYRGVDWKRVVTRLLLEIDNHYK